MKPIRERDVEKHLIEQTKKRGGEVRKVKWIGRAHAPDRLLLLPQPLEHGRHVLVELKAPGKKASRGQAREHIRLRRANFDVRVLDTIGKIDSFFHLHDRGWNR